MEAGRAGDPGPLWITAQRQTAGRGRRARSWVSAPGNLFASLLLIDPAEAAAFGNLPLVAALGIRNGIASLPFGTEPEIAIKWPNDVLIRGRKAAGILIESRRLADGRTAVVIGCGVNVASFPSDTPYAATSLSAEGCRAGLLAVFETVAAGLEEALSSWDRGGNFRVVRVAWLQHAVGLGQPCRVNLADRSIDGIFTDLDDAGRLLLTEADGATRAISAGDVFPLASTDTASTYAGAATQ